MKRAKMPTRCAASGIPAAEVDAIFVPAAPPRLCLQPLYMRRFVCDGSRCDSLCCRAKWGVALDAATLARYEERPELLQELKKGLERSEATGGWVMRHENDRCVFLRADGLCSLHRRFGIGAISDVCAEYPRKMHEVGDTLDRALCLSCPVAAEDVLFAAEPMAFEWVEVGAPRSAYVDRAPLGAPLSACAFRALQMAGISLLQERRFAIDARLAALGLLLAHAEAYVERGAAEDLARDAFAIAEAATGHAGTLLAANPFDAAGYADVFLRLFPALAKATDDDLPETTAYLAALRRAFGEASSLSVRRRRWKAQVLAPYGGVLENWLVNEFLLGRYPLLGGTSFLANYEVFVVTYKMLEVLLLADEALDEDAASAPRTEMRGDAKDMGEARWQRTLLAAVAWLAVRTNHFPGYIDALAEAIARLLPGDRLFTLLDGDS